MQVLSSLAVQAKKVKNKPLFRRPEGSRDEKKECKEDKKTLKDLLKICDTIEKELNVLVTAEKEIEQKAIAVRAMKKAGTRRTVVDEVEEVCYDQEPGEESCDTHDGPTKLDKEQAFKEKSSYKDRTPSDRSISPRSSVSDFGTEHSWATSQADFEKLVRLTKC